MLAVWQLSLLLVLPFAALFLLIEGAFVSANAVKVRGLQTWKGGRSQNQPPRVQAPGTRPGWRSGEPHGRRAKSKKLPPAPAPEGGHETTHLVCGVSSSTPVCVLHGSLWAPAPAAGLGWPKPLPCDPVTSDSCACLFVGIVAHPATSIPPPNCAEHKQACVSASDCLTCTFSPPETSPPSRTAFV